MITTKVNANIRISPQLKEQTHQIANQMWLSFSWVVNLLLKKLILEQKIEISIQPKVELTSISKQEMKKITKLTNFKWFMENSTWP